MTKTKLYVAAVTLSIQDNVKLLHQLKSGFKRTINLNKYQSYALPQAQNQYLNHLVNPKIQGVSRHFVLFHEYNAHQTNYKRYFKNKGLHC